MKCLLSKTLATIVFALVSFTPLPALAQSMDAWFAQFKNEADDERLYRFLYALPKGGDLHIHLSGSIHPEWLYDEALKAQDRGYRYFTKTRINNCRFGSNEYGGAPYLLLFRTIPEVAWNKLDECERGEYTAMAELSPQQKQQWHDALRLDQPFEGRAEFFEAHWPRLGGLLSDPHIMAETIFLNMQAFGAEGVRYIEGQIPIYGFIQPDGTPISVDEVLDIYRARISQDDAKATGVEIRFQVAILRFMPYAEDALRRAYQLVAANEDLVAINMVGREDNDKGYPLRFLPVMREMRRTLPGVNLSIHAGEVDEPNQHIRDTLLLGAKRIGHGVNLITDPDTMLLMRHNQFMVEVNLVSNLLLEYVRDYSEHPFPEYLRTGIPVALSTDDRGMWDSTMTDEFFVAVKEFNLSFIEIEMLLHNSLHYAFVEEDVKQQMLADLDTELTRFKRSMRRNPERALDKVTPIYRGFICRRYALCGTAP